LTRIEALWIRSLSPAFVSVRGFPIFKAAGLNRQGPLRFPFLDRVI
jgi:hypothetical protein